MASWTETERGESDGLVSRGRATDPRGDDSGYAEGLPRSASVQDIHSVRADLLQMQQEMDRAQGEPLVVSHARRLEYLRVLERDIRGCREHLERLEAEVEGLA